MLKPPENIYEPEKTYTFTERQLSLLLRMFGLSVAVTQHQFNKGGTQFHTDIHVYPEVLKTIRNIEHYTNYQFKDE